jgi:hypothetical protein
MSLKGNVKRFSVIFAFDQQLNIQAVIFGRLTLAGIRDGVTAITNDFRRGRAHLSFINADYFVGPLTGVFQPYFSLISLIHIVRSSLRRLVACFITVLYLLPDQGGNNCHDDRRDQRDRNQRPRDPSRCDCAQQSIRPHHVQNSSRQHAQP